jgi:hypothetical protein
MAEIPLTLALSPMERRQEFRLPSPQGEGLGMRANHVGIQQRCYFIDDPENAIERTVEHVKDGIMLRMLLAVKLIKHPLKRKSITRCATFPNRPHPKSLSQSGRGTLTNSCPPSPALGEGAGG